VGDNVEIHGIVTVDAAGKSSLQATRIAQQAAAAYSRVVGTIVDLSTTAKTFKLGTLLIDYSAAKLQPADATLSNGEQVRVSTAAAPRSPARRP
jgi:hypothetical protein